MQEKMLMKKKKLNIFKRINIFFKRLFYKEQTQNTIDDRKSDTEKLGMIETLRKEQEMLNIQMKYENGSIKESDLSDVEKEELTKLYESQIKTLEENILTYKNKLKNYKEKIINAKNSNIAKK